MMIRDHLTLITPPSVAVLDLEIVKKARRFSPTTLDALFDSWIQAATEHFEQQTGRQLLTATWEYGLDAFPSCRWIEIPHAPLQAVTSVTYFAGTADEAVMSTDDYVVVAPAGPRCARGRVALVEGAMWPTTQVAPHSVRIRYTAGYGHAPGAVPELIKVALHFLVGHFHRFGEDVQQANNAQSLVRVPMGAQTIMRKFRLPDRLTVEA